MEDDNPIYGIINEGINSEEESEKNKNKEKKSSFSSITYLRNSDTNKEHENPPKQSHKLSCIELQRKTQLSIKFPIQNLPKSNRYSSKYNRYHNFINPNHSPNRYFKGVDKISSHLDKDIQNLKKNSSISSSSSSSSSKKPKSIPLFSNISPCSAISFSFLSMEKSKNAFINEYFNVFSSHKGLGKQSLKTFPRPYAEMGKNAQALRNRLNKRLEEDDLFYGIFKKKFWQSGKKVNDKSKGIKNNLKKLGSEIENKEKMKIMK